MRLAAPTTTAPERRKRRADDRPSGLPEGFASASGPSLTPCPARNWSAQAVLKPPQPCLCLMDGTEDVRALSIIVFAGALTFGKEHLMTLASRPRTAAHSHLLLR